MSDVEEQAARAARLRMMLDESWRLVEASRQLIDETHQICQRSIRRYRETEKLIALMRRGETPWQSP